MSIRTRLLVSISAWLVLHVALAAAFIWSSFRARDGLETVRQAQEQVESIRRLGRNAYELFDRLERRNSEGGGNTAILDSVEEMRRNLDDLAACIKLSEAMIDDEEEREEEGAELLRVQSIWRMVSGIADAAAAQDSSAFGSAVIDSCRDELIAELDSACVKEDSEIQAAQSAIARNARTVALWALLGSLLTVAIETVVGLRLMRAILHPIKLLESGAAAIKSGHLDHRIHLPGNNEFAQLAAGFNAMAVTLEGQRRGLADKALLEAEIEVRRSAEHDLGSARDKLQAVFASLGDGLFVLDTEGNCLLVNPAAEQLLGLTEAELVGRPILEQIAGMQFESELLSKTTRNEDATFRGKNGISIPVSFVMNPFLRDGVPHGCVLAFRDITQLKHGETALAAAQEVRAKMEIELHQAQKLEAVGRLAAGVAHEINTPVQFTNDSVTFAKDAFGDLAQLIEEYRVLTQSVMDGTSSPQAAVAVRDSEEKADLEYLLEHLPTGLDRALEGLTRVASIVRSMKEFAHPDQKEMTSVNLNQAISSTLTVARNEYKYVADLEMDLGDIPHVTCHAGAINQVILNLVVNAAHAIGDVVGDSGAKGRLTVRTRSDGDHVLISIGDTGTGIPPEFQGRIFEPFFTTKEVGKGTGQGLALARQVVSERHGGSLTFETERGKGTTFFIRIPFQGKPSGSSIVAA